MTKAALCALVVAVLAGCGGDDERPLLAAGKTAVVRGALVPDVHLFAEPIVARVEVVVDRSKADPDDVRVQTDFEPYDSVGATRVRRQDVGRYTRLRFETTLRCLTEDCIPRTASGDVTVNQLPGLPPFLPGQQRDEKRKYEFPPAIVTVSPGADDSDGATLGRVVWPPLRSVSRINWDDSRVVGQGFPFVATVAPLPEPSYRVSPTGVGVALLLAALALLILPARLLWRRRARPGSREADAASLSPLERALALVEWASRRPSPGERREALEALAFELQKRDDGERVQRAREVGWSPPAPESDRMNDLVTSVREDDGSAS